ncbi:MAG: DUF3800 domain-containing protein [Pseudomonadota bacterium]
MPRRYLFADEAGCFTFNRKPNISRYFILCTVLMDDLGVVNRLQNLRHDLLCEGVPLGDYFHATTDTFDVRDAVFEAILDADFSVQATICEKSKAQPQVRVSKARFYKYPWYYHFRHGIPKQFRDVSEFIVTAASIGNKKERSTFTNSLGDVMSQTLGKRPWHVDFRPSQSDPALQVADYCAWAIQRKWERQETKAYDLIEGRITYEYELWRRGRVHYY